MRSDKRISMKESTMSITEELLAANARRSKEQNKAAAERIASTGDKKAVAELIKLLSCKDKTVQSDAVEILYETGYLNPACITDGCKEFVALLTSRNNRLVWGAMIALSRIASVAPDRVFPHLPLIRQTVDRGSVITKDAGVVLYAQLVKMKKYRTDVVPLLFDELKMCPIKQLPQYVEKSVGSIDTALRADFMDIVEKRSGDLGTESRVKRIRKALTLLRK